MNRHLPASIPLLACALLAAAAACATPRGEAIPPEPQTPESSEAMRLQLATDMAVWLPRMVGHFKIEGVVEFTQTEAAGQGELDAVKLPNVRPVNGKADCIAVGSGAGVQCVIHAAWEDEWQPNGMPVEGGVSFIGPAAILYGFDPNAAQIRYLLLNTNGIAETRTGTLEGNTVRFYFDFRCESDPNPEDNPTRLCRRVMGLYAPPEAKHITISIDIEPWSETLGTWLKPLTRISVDMRRIQPEQPGEASNAPATTP